MPVSFEQPSPIGVGIQSAYGATEQYNKTLPVLAGLYESIGRNVNQAAGETARNQTQANISDSDNLARQQSQMASQQFQAQAQQRQIAAEQDHQATQQAFQWATQERAITQSDRMQYAQTQQAVSEIQKMVTDGYITQEEAAPYILKAKTKIDVFDERQKKAHAEDLEAQADLRRQQTSNLQKDNEDAKAFQADMIEQGHSTFMMTDPNGKRHVMIKNDQNGEWYNPLLQHMKGGLGQDDSGPASDRWPSFQTKEGEFDYSKARKDAESRAKDVIPPVMKADKDGGKEKDTAEEDRRDWIKRRMEGVEREFNEDKAKKKQSSGQNFSGETRPVPGGPQGQTEGPDQGSGEGGTSAISPSQQAQAANDQRDPLPKIAAQLPKIADTEKQKVDALPVSNMLKTQLKEYLDAASEIAAKPYKTDEDRRNYANYRRLFEEQKRKWQ